MNDRTRIVRVANWLAGMIGLVVVVLLPLGYFTIAHNYTASSLNVEAEINSHIFSELINKNPDFWQFEQMRLNELLKRRPGTGELEIRRIFNLQNHVVAESADPLTLPLIIRSYPLKDSGQIVGRIEISRSMLPILTRAGVITCFGLIIGLIVYIAIKTLPFQAIIKAENALRASEEQYRTLFDNMLNGLAYCRMIHEKDHPKDFIHLKVNNAFEKLTGLKDVVGKRVSEAIPGIQEADPELIEICDRVCSTGEPEALEIFVHSLSMWFSISVYSPYREHFVAIFELINERKQAEALLRESEERFRLLLKNANDAVYVHEATADGSGKFIEVNDQATSMLGYSRDELLCMGLTDIEVPEQREKVPAGVRDLDKTGRCLVETEHTTKDGRRVMVEISSRLLELGGNPIILSVVRDLSERKRLEAEHQRLQEQLQQMQKIESLGCLAGGVAHDYNNMLSVIIGYTELSLEGIKPGDPLYENLGEVLKAARQASDVTRQLLTFARKQIIQPRKLDLNETVEKMLKMLKRLIGEDIDLRWIPENDLWPIMMDPSQINHILANLCINARDAIGRDGKITIETHRVIIDEAYCTDHSGFIAGNFVILSVSDNGHGMDKDTCQKIFDPFFTTKEMGRGTGLGLATVYGIVKQNKGFLNVYSEPAKGTTFRIYLPRKEGVAEMSKSASASLVSSGRGESVLIVEDEPSILKICARMLEKLGYRVLTADTPGKALRLAETHIGAIDLLLVDVVMPEMNGRDLATRLNAIFPEIKTLFMSGYTADMIAHQGVLDDGINFIQKPASMEELASKVRTLLDK